MLHAFLMPFFLGMVQFSNKVCMRCMCVGRGSNSARKFCKFFLYEPFPKTGFCMLCWATEFKFEAEAQLLVVSLSVKWVSIGEPEQAAVSQQRDPCTCTMLPPLSFSPAQVPGSKPDADSWETVPRLKYWYASLISQTLIWCLVAQGCGVVKAATGSSAVKSVLLPEQENLPGCWAWQSGQTCAFF